MPIREYDCGKCGQHYEKIMPGFTPQPIDCEGCGDRLEAKVSAAYVPKKGRQTNIMPSELGIGCAQGVHIATKVREQTQFDEDGTPVFTVADYKTVDRVEKNEFN